MCRVPVSVRVCILLSCCVLLCPVELVCIAACVVGKSYACACAGLCVWEAWCVLWRVLWASPCVSVCVRWEAWCVECTDGGGGVVDEGAVVLAVTH